MQVPANTTTISGSASDPSGISPAFTGSIFGKSGEAAIAKKDLLPSFAATFAGQSAATGVASEGKELAGSASGGAIDADDVLPADGATGAASAMHELLDHHLFVEKKLMNVASTVSAAPAKKESKEEKHSAAAIPSHPQDVRKLVEGSHSNASTVLIPVAAPAMPLQRHAEEWSPGLSAATTAHAGSQLKNISHEEAPQPAVSQDNAKTSIPSIMHDSPVDISNLESHPPQHTYAEADAISPAVSPGLNPPGSSVPVEEVRGHEVSSQKIQGKPKVEEKFASAAARLSPVSAAGTFSIDTPRTASDTTAATSLPRIIPAADGGTKRDASVDTGGAFQHLDSGEAPPTLIHSNAHSITVGVHDPALGWLEVQTQNSAGHLSATLTTASSEAHANLAAEAPAITQYLADRNISVHSLHVGEQGTTGGGEGQAGSGNTRQQAFAQNEVPVQQGGRAARQATVEEQGIPVAVRNSRISVRA